MKRIFTLLSSAFVIVNVFAEDMEYCVKYKDGYTQCYPIDEIDEMYMHYPYKASGQILDKEYVDLGLPSGLLWATYDVGADEIKHVGTLYSWGEVETSDNYNWRNLKYYHEEGTKYWFDKYVNSTLYYDSPDNLLRLEPEDDAATANWGSSWRTPTKEEFDELINSCTWQVIVNPEILIQYAPDGEPVPTYALIGTSIYNGKKIYFAKGNSQTYDSVDLLTRYWTSDINEENHFNAWMYYIGFGDATDVSKKFSLTNDCRYVGCSIRPVSGGKK